MSVTAAQFRVDKVDLTDAWDERTVVFYWHDSRKLKCKNIQLLTNYEKRKMNVIEIIANPTTGIKWSDEEATEVHLLTIA